jgi:hypothetical protein
MSKYVVPNYDAAARGKLPAAAMRWALSDKRVSLLAIGMGYREEVDQNAATLSADLTLTDADRKLLADYSAKAYKSPRIKAMGVDQEKRSSEETARTVIEQNDKDGDGRLSRREFPSGQLQYFDACDRDNDGYASLSELAEAIKRRRSQ